MRASVYAMLSRFLAEPPAGEVLAVARGLTGDETEFGQALAQLGNACRDTNAEDAEDEFTRLFYGFGAGGELNPYASTYLTGFVYDRPLADLRVTLGRLGLARTDATREPEDHIAVLMEAMHLLIMSGEDLGVQRAFFDAHMAPWAGTFFADLERAAEDSLFGPVGTLGKLMVDIERRAFDMAA